MRLGVWRSCPGVGDRRAPLRWAEYAPRAAAGTQHQGGVMSTQTALQKRPQKQTIAALVTQRRTLARWGSCAACPHGAASEPTAHRRRRNANHTTPPPSKGGVCSKKAQRRNERSAPISPPRVTHHAQIASPRQTRRLNTLSATTTKPHGWARCRSRAPPARLQACLLTPRRLSTLFFFFFLSPKTFFQTICSVNPLQESIL